MFVGHDAAEVDLGAVVEVAVGAADDDDGRPNAAQLNPPYNN